MLETNLKFKMLLFQPIVAKTALIGWIIIFIENIVLRTP